MRSGDVVDISFKKSLNVRAVYIVTGFDREEERAGMTGPNSGGVSVLTVPLTGYCTISLLYNK